MVAGMEVAGKAVDGTAVGNEGNGDGVKVGVEGGVNVKVSVGKNETVLTESGVCVADSG
jgi:hypothetical protein